MNVSLLLVKSQHFRHALPTAPLCVDDLERSAALTSHTCTASNHASLSGDFSRRRFVVGASQYVVENLSSAHKIIA